MRPDVLTAGERAQVQLRVDAGAVTVLAQGVSSYAYPVWDAKEHRLVGTDPAANWRGNGSAFFGRKRQVARRGAGAGARTGSGAAVVSEAVLARRAQVAVLHGAGLIMRDIAQAIGDVHANTIRADLDALGLVPHPFNRPTAVDHGARLARIRTLAAQGQTREYIGKAIGICTDAVGKLASKHKIQIIHKARPPKAGGASVPLQGAVSGGLAV